MKYVLLMSVMMVGCDSSLKIRADIEAGESSRSAIYHGSCTELGDVVINPEVLPAGAYAVAVESVDACCQTVSKGCTNFSVPGTTEVSVAMTPSPPAPCDCSCIPAPGCGAGEGEGEPVGEVVGEGEGKVVGEGEGEGELVGEGEGEGEGEPFPYPLVFEDHFERSGPNWNDEELLLWNVYPVEHTEDFTIDRGVGMVVVNSSYTDTYPVGESLPSLTYTDIFVTTTVGPPQQAASRMYIFTNIPDGERITLTVAATDTETQLVLSGPTEELVDQLLFPAVGTRPHRVRLTVGPSKACASLWFVDEAMPLGCMVEIPTAAINLVAGRQGFGFAQDVGSAEADIRTFDDLQIYGE